MTEGTKSFRLRLKHNVRLDGDATFAQFIAQGMEASNRASHQAAPAAAVIAARASPKKINPLLKRVSSMPAPIGVWTASPHRPPFQ